jgi:hypothetical protein
MLALLFVDLIGFDTRYIPQAWLNYRRKHVKGFSKLGIVIKHIGASFLWINSMILGGSFSLSSLSLSHTHRHYLLFTSPHSLVFRVLIKESSDYYS